VDALTGTHSLTLVRDDQRTLERAAALLRTTPDDIVAAVERLLARQREAEDALKGLQRELARGEATRLAAGARGGVVVERRDGLDADQLRELAVATRDEPGVTTVVLAGTPDGERVVLAGAVDRDTDVPIGEVVAAAARLCGGGGGGKGEVAVAGGRDVTKIDDALAATRARLGIG
jgi:alanyl-tRNA synthetase